MTTDDKKAVRCVSVCFVVVFLLVVGNMMFNFKYLDLFYVIFITYSYFKFLHIRRKNQKLYHSMI